ncbi:sensor histidine kinase [Arsenicibacter rosenii]|uniref:Signal transduction histidine kinase internal region domain-containing protein n=1 Tax=Arsenicibacter rosenii TaxID=1750698 RepID=A0A1S2VHT7_9BACT|nr:histidine kinase [Arsenicibacter rosenii]OIN57776.1 hypothetical protein BLX24_18545 [Arsenicibacter rosenii]
MSSAKSYRLSVWQIAQLALFVLVVYYPILLYVNLPDRSWDFIMQALPYLLMQGGLMFLLYFFWIGIVEWLLQKLADRFGDQFMFEFKWPGQLVSIVVTICFAMFFNVIFHQIRRQVLKNPNRQEVAGQRPSGQQRPAGDQASGPATTNWRGRNGSGRWEFFERSNNGLAVVIMLSIFYLAANRRANRRMKDIQVEAERLEKENALAQFAALKNQVSPHFLFNSLSILSSLVYVDPALSEQFIDRLSKAYRYILEQKDNDRVLLRTELEFIQAYIFLLKIRFDEKFSVVLDVPERVAEQNAIAPLTLQLLIENAVKHNRMTSKQPLEVQIRVEGNELVVRNRIQPRDDHEPSTGIGLQNIINRYHLLTSQPVWVGEQQGEFVVRIPLIAQTVAVA